jgi:hypothetical protein
LDWCLPDFSMTKKEELKNSGLINKDADALRTIQISSNKMSFKCHISPITMGYLGEIGWYLKLDSIAD